MSTPLSSGQQAVLDGAVRFVRDQAGRVAETDRPTVDPPEAAFGTPFGLGYLFGAVDALCQANGVAFDGMALAIFALTLDQAVGRPADALRRQALDLEAAGDADFARGRTWGGNEAAGWARGQHEPVGLVHLAHGDEHRMQ
ncbi:hypothetical protein RQM47_02325 [Rubrivirga sp. S365]|uniref:hypothetical protein n=1 Tax=Rubrivirga sp. S365 TaxID=3076080 RepID=UPI0028C5EFEF|nr:hypothetical protein [Rubrivirga sp. S365]MDT7855473.1 hypothetical protein [Rubrivirga sp. S365]